MSAPNDYSIFANGIDMDPARFATELAGSPALKERAAAEYLDAIARHGLSARFMLAVFGKESTYGRNPRAIVTTHATKNWGNCRSNQGGGRGTVIQTPKGPFVKYDTWLDGLNDACYRLLKPGFAYERAKATTVRTVIPIWAPAGENDTTRYIRDVLARMAKWERQDQPGTSVPIRDCLIPAGNSNRPGTALRGGKPSFITIHETANLNAGANAEMHRRFTHGADGWGGGGHPAGWWQGTHYQEAYEGVSFHYVVDDTEAVQLLPDHEIGYHAGDGLGPNSGGATSIGIEACVNQDGDWTRTCANLAWLVRHLMRKHGIPIERVVPHHRWSGKNCPARLRQSGWAPLVGAIQAAHVVTPARPEPPANYDAVTGQYIGEPLLAYYLEHGGVTTIGRPLGPMVLYSDDKLRQLFERRWLAVPKDGGVVTEEGLGQAWVAATGRNIVAHPDATPLA